MAQQERVKGNEAFKAGDLREAQAYYSRAIEADPSCKEALSNRSATRLKLGLTQGAEEDASRCIEVDPGFPKGWLRRARARRARGDLEGAMQDAARGREAAAALAKDL